MPGKNTSSGTSSYESLHGQVPSLSTDRGGDMVGNIGVTEGLSSVGTTMSNNLYNFCPILDERGYLEHFERPSLTPSDEVKRLSTQQNISSTLLEPFVRNSSGGAYSNLDRLLSSFDSTVDQPSLHENRCLRAPGSSCFTDLDCAPLFHWESKPFFCRSSYRSSSLWPQRL